MPKIFTIKMLNGDLFEVESRTIKDIDPLGRWNFGIDWQIGQIKNDIEKMYYDIPEFQTICQHLSKDEEKDDLYYLLLRTDFSVLLKNCRSNEYELKWLLDNKIVYGINFCLKPFQNLSLSLLLSLISDKLEDSDKRYNENKKGILFTENIKQKIEEKWEEFISIKNCI